MSAAVNRVQTSRGRDPAAIHRRALTPAQTHVPDPQREPDPIRDAFLKGSWSHPAGPAATLSRADPRTRAGMVVQLQRTHGNSYVQRTIAESRHFSPARHVTIQRCGGTPCNCSPAERVSHAVQEMPAIVERVAGEALAGEIDRTRGRGRALDPIARAKLEPAMGLDLGHVSIHHDGDADVLARNVDAEAFTTDSDIYFRAGSYEPHSERGLRLIAHEVAHTVQQGRGAVSSPQRFAGAHITDPDDAFEQEADEIAAETMARVNQNHTPTGAGREKAGASDRGVVGRSSVQRRASHSAPVIQRALLTRRSGNFTATFDPFARVTNPAQSGRYTANPFKETFAVTAGAAGKVFLIVDMTWARVSGGGGPGPGPGPTPIPGLDCSKLPPGTPPQIVALCRQGGSCKQVLDQFVSTETICPLLLPLIATGIGAIVPALCFIGGPLVLPLIKDELAKLIGCQGGGGTTPPPQPTRDTGTGRARLELNYFVGADGKMQFVGPPAQVVDSNGIGAEVVSPVISSQSPTPGGGNVSIAPQVRGVTSIARPTGETVQETHSFSEMFEADLNLPPPPPPIPFCFATRLFPFITGKDKFERPEEEQLKLLTWFRGMDPRVRNRVFAAKSPVVVAGRASRLGSPKFDNLGLSEKRAKTVKQMVNDFGGSFAGVNTFAFGALTAEGPDINAAEDRRADVRVSGQLEGSEAAGGPLVIPPFQDERPCGDSDLPPLESGGGGAAAIAEGEGAGGPVFADAGAGEIPGPAPAALPGGDEFGAFPGGGTGENVLEMEGGGGSFNFDELFRGPGGLGGGEPTGELPAGGGGGGLIEELTGAGGGGGGGGGGLIDEFTGGPGGEGGGLIEELFGEGGSIGGVFSSENEEDNEFELE